MTVWWDKLCQDEGWNAVVDELEWHWDHGRVLASIRVQWDPAGVEFRFANAAAEFFPIDAEYLPYHWLEAIAILTRVPELADVTFEGPPPA